MVLGSAADHFVAGFKGHPRSRLWRAGPRPFVALHLGRQIIDSRAVVGLNKQREITRLTELPT